MNAYLITSGAIFGLVTIAHLVRMILENRHLATDPPYILLTILSAGLCFWAFALLRRAKRLAMRIADTLDGLINRSSLIAAT